jgi:hypothetical protein
MLYPEKFLFGFNADRAVGSDQGICGRVDSGGFA